MFADFFLHFVRSRKMQIFLFFIREILLYSVLRKNAKLERRNFAKKMQKFRGGKKRTFEKKKWKKEKELIMILFNFSNFKVGNSKKFFLLQLIVATIMVFADFFRWDIFAFFREISYCFCIFSLNSLSRKNAKFREKVCIFSYFFAEFFFPWKVETLVRLL